MGGDLRRWAETAEDGRELQKIGGNCKRWAGTAEDGRGLQKIGGTAEDGQECFVVPRNKAQNESQRDCGFLTRSRPT